MLLSKSILIVWHSRTQGAQHMAKVAEQAIITTAKALEVAITPSLKRANEVNLDDFLSAQAIVFCAPENLGSLSGEMKECLDKHYYALIERLNGIPYQTFICAGSDGQGAAKQLARIVTGWRLQAHHSPLIWITQAQTQAQIEAPKVMPEAIRLACHECIANLTGQLALSLLD